MTIACAVETGQTRQEGNGKVQCEESVLGERRKTAGSRAKRNDLTKRSFGSVAADTAKNMDQQTDRAQK